MFIAASAYQGRVVIPTGHPSRVDAWGGAWEAVEDVPGSRTNHAYGSLKIRLNKGAPAV